ncbi:hypothetical protein ALMP_59390 [Streptomyces sp. A012304]|nr:hypothetical protein ALMP_59390 [Streptomyces sp. A012304]
MLSVSRSSSAYSDSEVSAANEMQGALSDQCRTARARRANRRRVTGKAAGKDVGR